MRMKPWAAVAAAVPLATGCIAGLTAVPASATTGAPASSPPAWGAPASSGLAPSAPHASASRTAKPPQVPPGTTASWLVYDRRAGKLVATRHAHRKFRSASVTKILIAIDFLDRRASLSAADARLLRVMLRESDDAAATAFWNRGGKGAIITRMARKLRLSDTAPPPATHPGFWGYASLSAHDIVRTYRYLLDTAQPRVRDTILGHLRKATPCGSDGFDQTFGIPQGVPGPRAVKQGWSGFGTVPPVKCDARASGASISTVALRSAGTGVPDLGRPVLYTTGLVGKDERYVMALLTTHPAGSTWSSSVRRITTLAKGLYRSVT
ncbi:hypothetical protein LDL08_17115 [Nonomuraea glycinis]|uniref:hypothetical protein n=1 Tax=Nonomuraea glycinis TaxID=2047744 RepID=UPI0016697B54|nr:hypothetical protein [Nonomuraea glycinis]MCA2177913.1 hypothetical protein [Nonomuraea glycinis]